MSQRQSVLVLDDEPTVARGIQRLLRAEFEVKVAYSSDEARACLAEHVPDVLLCDYDLGTETSSVFLEQVTRDHPGVRRVLYSASRPEVWQHLLDRALIHTSLMKPATSEELMTVVRGSA